MDKKFQKTLREQQKANEKDLVSAKKEKQVMQNKMTKDTNNYNILFKNNEKLKESLNKEKIRFQKESSKKNHLDLTINSLKDQQRFSISKIKEQELKIKKFQTEKDLSQQEIELIKKQINASKSKSTTKFNQQINELRDENNKLNTNLKIAESAREQAFQKQSKKISEITETNIKQINELKRNLIAEKLKQQDIQIAIEDIDIQKQQAESQLSQQVNELRQSYSQLSNEVKEKQEAYSQLSQELKRNLKMQQQLKQTNAQLSNEVREKQEAFNQLSQLVAENFRNQNQLERANLQLSQQVDDNLRMQSDLRQSNAQLSHEVTEKEQLNLQLSQQVDENIRKEKDLKQTNAELSRQVKEKEEAYQQLSNEVKEKEMLNLQLENEVERQQTEVKQHTQIRERLGATTEDLIKANEDIKYANKRKLYYKRMLTTMKEKTQLEKQQLLDQITTKDKKIKLLESSMIEDKPQPTVQFIQKPGSKKRKLNQ